MDRAAASIAPRGPLVTVTTALVGVNTVVYGLMAISGISPMNPTTRDLLKWGADFGPLALGSEPWRMFTSTFVHAGLFHIGSNMWCLWNLGRLAERIFGRATYLTLYLLCGLAGSVMSLWWHPRVVGVGASGAVFGVAGGLITALVLGKLPFPKAAMRGTLQSLLIFAVFNLGFGQVAGGIDNSAHIGGLLAGLLLGAALAPTLAEPAAESARRRVLAFAVLLVMLFGGWVYLKHRQASVADLVRQGEVSLRKGDSTGAEALLGRASKLDPKSPEVQYYLGLSYMGTKRFAEAQKIFAGLSEEYPQYGDAFVLLGESLEELGQHDRAISAFQRALRIEPDNALAELGLARAYRAKGETDLADVATAKATEMDRKAKAGGK